MLIHDLKDHRKVGNIECWIEIHSIRVMIDKNPYLVLRGKDWEAIIFFIFTNYQIFGIHFEQAL